LSARETPRPCPWWAWGYCPEWLTWSWKWFWITMGIGFGLTAVLHLRSAGLLDWIPADLGVFAAVVFFIACVCIIVVPYRNRET
jgi:hypothetical protein